MESPLSIHGVVSFCGEVDIDEKGQIFKADDMGVKMIRVNQDFRIC